MQFLRRSLTGLLLLSVTLGLLAYAGGIFRGAVQERMNRSAQSHPESERIFTVNTIDVAPESAVPVMTAFGEVQSRRMLEIRAGAAGRIVELNQDFEAGALVEEGALLARIDPRAAESALQVARTDLDEAEAERRDAERTLDLVRDEQQAAQAQADLRTQALKRQQDLAQRGVGTEAAVETAALAEASANQAVVGRRMAQAAAENRVDVARNRLARAKIELADAERDLADTEVHAAFTGTLADVNVVEGGLVGQNERLATLIDARALEVSFRLPTIQYARLLDDSGNLMDLPVRVTLDLLGLDLEATGRISRVNASVGEGQTGRQLFARLDSYAGFRPGDFVTVHIAEPPLDEVAVLPAAAVDAASTVLALADGDRLEVLPVEVLRRQGDEVIVAGGPLAGRRLVAERSPLIGPGVKVRVIGASGGTELASESEAETIALTPERRAALIAAVEANTGMPAEARERILAQLRQDRVPTRMVERIEGRMGG